MNAAPVRVLLVDDDDLMRAGLSAVLSSDADERCRRRGLDGRVAVQHVRALRPISC